MARIRKLTDIEKLIMGITRDDDYEDQLVFIKKENPRKARYAPLHPGLPDRLASNLAKMGIRKLYTHQAEAVQRVRDGENIVLATDTASGKSLCYNIPIIEEIIINPDARALYLFPTKALGQDQTRMLHALIKPGDDFDETMAFYSLRMGRRSIRFGTYDGDTPREERTALRREGNVLLTNPDMLSMGILPNHNRYWSAFFEKLKFIVIDEIHMYRGVFGSHVANLMRRFVRVCEYYGSEPQFICCSATISNPAEHAQKLTGKKIFAITESGAPSAGRQFVLWNPPLLKGTKDTRRSPLTESINLFSFLLQSALRTIVFARAKPTVEVILKYTREKLLGSSVGPDSIMSYRGGYLPSERREIERALAEGDLLGVTCTNALELGIDIGSLDSVIINGYPGSISSVLQQAGRAGRRNKQSLAVLVAYNEPLDQYFMRNPEYFFGRQVEQAIVHPQNTYIMEMHLKAAAAELPLKTAEKNFFGENYIQIVRRLLREGILKEQKGGAYYVGDDYPAGKINLRTTSNQNYAICLENGDMIGQMDAAGAFNYIHDGAVYLHMGESYHVDKLDLDKKIATVVKKNLSYHTRSLSREWVNIDRVLREKKLGKTKIYFGYIEVTSKVHSFKKIRNKDRSTLGYEDLDYPEDRLWTQGFWFVLPASIEKEIAARGMDLMGGLHAVEHATIAMLPFLAMCDRMDIGGVSTDSHSDTEGRPVVFVHDAYEGGMGLSESGYERIGELFERTLELMEGCKCEDGCPSCIQSPKCGNMNQPLSKETAIFILKSIMGKK